MIGSRLVTFDKIQTSQEVGVGTPTLSAGIQLYSTRSDRVDNPIHSGAGLFAGSSSQYPNIRPVVDDVAHPTTVNNMEVLIDYDLLVDYEIKISMTVQSHIMMKHMVFLVVSPFKVSFPRQ
ncbi:hypothetical protein PIB30_105534 [Stylosanthes scabra]|uniref:Uncharacterized protein n=1 Tax=Stylosanthes scabra TaxID=79078 RepID=A0ABU6Y103_9FABA|nr:hypothetical protein [Stylosanthes scabra]